MAERVDVWFDSLGDRCAAWLYRPAGSGPKRTAPCVVMAHGWSAVREQRLDAFAERFHAAGLGVLVFDYRHFGSSEGEPRQLMSIRRQLEDWRCALTYARSLDWVDADRVALWGSSFSGAHVQWLAAYDRRIAATVANVPACDLLRNLPALGLGHAARLTLEGIRDLAGALRGRPPHLLAAVGPPGSLALMTTPDAESGFAAVTPPDAPWHNGTSARIVLTLAGYRPGARAERIGAPILYCIAEQDAITPAELAHAAAARAPRGETRSYQGGHFDPYVEPLFSQVVADQVEFLERHLLARG